jgi:hypothetical protein
MMTFVRDIDGDGCIAVYRRMVSLASSSVGVAGGRRPDERANLICRFHPARTREVSISIADFFPPN